MSNEPTRKPPARSVPINRELFRRLRMAAGLSQTRLAGLAELSPQQISAIENGDNGVSPAALARIAPHLNCKVADLMTRVSA